MGKKVHNDVLDAALDKIATSSRMSICSAEPADFAGIAAVALAQVAMTPGDGNDYTIGDEGGGDGRIITTVQKADVPVTGAGTQDGDHVCLDDGTTLLYVTTCTTQALTNGNTVTIPAWEINLADPTP